MWPPNELAPAPRPGKDPKISHDHQQWLIMIDPPSKPTVDDYWALYCPSYIGDFLIVHIYIYIYT